MKKMDNIENIEEDNFFSKRDLKILKKWDRNKSKRYSINYLKLIFNALDNAQDTISTQDVDELKKKRYDKREDLDMVWFDVTEDYLFHFLRLRRLLIELKK
jgi:hypothetical protein